MRTIKFRAWDKENNRRWYIAPELKELGLVTLNTLPNFLILQNENSSLVELSQFTGLHDKNGEEIYEGDIVKTQWGGVGKVIFKENAFQYVFQSGDFYCRVNKKNTQNRDLKVIGNIYENPELLKSSNEA